MRTKFYSVIIQIVFFVFVSGVMAEENQSRVFELGEVVVTAEKNAPAIPTVRTVTSDDITLNGAKTLNEAISLVPGLYVRNGGEGTPRLDIRGFRTRQVRLFLNGIPMNDSYDSQFDPTTIPVENIAEIKMITGGSSVLYGPGGAGGIINIITKKGEQGFHGSAQVEAAREDTRLGRATISAGLDKWNVFLGASTYKSDGFNLSDDFQKTASEDGGLRGNSDIKRNNLFSNIGYDPSEKTHLGLTLNYIDGENGIPSIANYNANDIFQSKPKFERIDDLSGFGVQLSASHEFDSPLSMRGWAFLNELKQLDNRYDDALYTTQTKSGASSADSKTDISGGDLQAAYDFNKYGTSSFGVMMEKDKYDASGFNVKKVKNNNVKTPFDYNKEFTIYSFLLQHDMTPVQNVTVSAGYGYNIQDRTDTGNETASSYMLGATYRLNEKTLFKGSIDRKIQFPSIRQLYDPDSGNTGLKPERAMEYELGVVQSLPLSTTGSVTGFINDAKNFIEKDDTLNLFRNFEHYYFKGVEVALENRAVKNLILKAMYSYLVSKDKSAGSTVDELQYRPGNKFSVEGSYSLESGFTAYASILYVGHQYFYSTDTTVPLQKKELNNYTVVNLKVSQSIMKDRLAVYLGANNLMDKNYEQSYGLPQPGRTIYGGLTARF
jgi:vitamin B12 transporter